MSERNGKEEIVICKHCNQPEYWGDMRWNNGRCMCRDCYREDYERAHRQNYKWGDLDGKRPTMNEYLDQEDRKEKQRVAVCY